VKLIEVTRRIKPIPIHTVELMQLLKNTIQLPAD